VAIFAVRVRKDFQIQARLRSRNSEGDGGVSEKKSAGDSSSAAEVSVKKGLPENNIDSKFPVF
jgi:hypothetical protein